MSTSSEKGQSLEDIFQGQYTEFCNDLVGACPELSVDIGMARALSPKERKEKFREEVLASCSPTRNATECPGIVLPGVCIEEDVWTSLSTTSQKAIQEYMTILSFSLLMEDGVSGDMKNGWTAEWAKKMMEDMKNKVNTMDFSKMSEKFAKLFGAGDKGFPQIPEKFLKGQIAKLAEDIVRELKIEDFGIDPAEMEAAGHDPSKAIAMMMNVFTNNPQIFQGTIAKLTKKLQQKVQSGALRPHELVAEAEELMKTFSENPEFVEMMETFRQSFGFEDMEKARSVGREGEARLNLVRSRLRKKLEAKKAKAKAAENGGGK